jgi:phage-related protein
MRAADEGQRVERPLVWVGSSKKDISALPDPVKGSFGFRLRQLQRGENPQDMKALKQFGAAVIELRESFDGNAYRCIVLVKMKNAIYVLHAFIKKSKSGIGLPKPDVEVIRARLKRARELDEEN